MILFQSFNLEVFAQNFILPSFHCPVDITVFLSGNYGELRGSHFHGGIDIKTQGEEGKIVRSIQEGYISRIKIMPNGYGNVIYISHPTGYSSVYGHLKEFTGKIAEYVTQKQYNNETFAIELFPDKSELIVKTGDTIAYSGNSGSSGGPHLHFEIRNSKNENSLNPLLFKFPVKDDIKPKIKTVSIYPLTENSYVNKSLNPNHISVTGSLGKYKINKENIIEVYGEIGFGIDVIDQLNDSHNQCGIYSIELFVDNQRIFYSVVDDLPFSQTRSILSHIDYKERQLTGRDVQKSFVEPGNKLNFYKQVVNRGWIKFTDNLIHSIKYVVKDAYLNTSELSFEVKSLKHENPVKGKIEPYQKLFPYNQANIFSNEEINIAIPEGALFSDLAFRYKKEERIPKTYSSIHKIGSSDIPLNSYYSIALQAIDLPVSLYKKAIIVNVSGSAGKYSFASAGGTWKDGMVSARVRNFGRFAIAVDTVPPVIKAVNIQSGKNMNDQKSIRFTISDNLSGISSYVGKIDGNWVLFKYDEKNKLIWFDFDESRIKKGRLHNLQLEVQDNRSNKSRWDGNFTW